MRREPPGAPPLFREIDHTADVGIIVEAASPSRLFEKAGLAMYALMTGPASVATRERRTVAAGADGWTELLQRWLTELLALFCADGFVAADVSVEDIEPTRVRGTVGGERFDPARHDFCREIKAVTYHELAVSSADTGWQARVIFDV